MRHLKKNVRDKNYLSTSGLNGNAVLTHHQCKHDQRNKLGRVSFSGSHTDLRTGINVNTAMRFAANGRAHCVSYAENQSTASFAIAKCQQSVCRLTWIPKEKIRQLLLTPRTMGQLVFWLTRRSSHPTAKWRNRHHHGKWGYYDPGSLRPGQP